MRKSEKEWTEREMYIFMLHSSLLCMPVTMNAVKMECGKMDCGKKESGKMDSSKLVSANHKGKRKGGKRMCTCAVSVAVYQAASQPAGQ